MVMIAPFLQSKRGIQLDWVKIIAGTIQIDSNRLSDDEIKIFFKIK